MICLYVYNMREFGVQSTVIAAPRRWEHKTKLSMPGLSAQETPNRPLHGAATRNSPCGSRGGPFNINIIILSQPFWPKTVVGTADTHAIDTHGTADTDAMWNSNEEWWHNVL